MPQEAHQYQEWDNMSEPIVLEPEEIVAGIGDQKPQIRGIYSGDDAAVSVAGFARDQSYILTFKHTGTGHSVSFPSIIESFNDTHTADASEKTFLTIPNPLITQGGTGRQISLTFKVLSASLGEARFNTQSVNMLLQMLYPTLNEQGVAIFDPYITISGFSMLNDSSSQRSTECIIQNITYSLNPDEGFIMSRDSAEGELHPISLTINISAIAILPTISSEDAQKPFPSDYPRYR